MTNLSFTILRPAGQPTIAVIAPRGGRIAVDTSPVL